ncbi:hypothetical protein D3C86_2100970 [compost metagenome]
MQEDLAIGGQVVGNPGRQADAKIHVRSFRDVAGNALGQLLMSQFIHVCSLSGLGLARGRYRDDALNKNARRDHRFRVQFA